MRLAILALLAPLAAAAPPKYELRLPGSPTIAARVGGARAVECSSRWHRGTFRARLRGAAKIPVNALLPPEKIEVGGSWPVHDEIAQRIAETLVDRDRDVPHEPEAWKHWTGGQPRAVRSRTTGQLNATLARIEADGTAVVSVQGRLAVWQMGNMANRYGPNTWEIEWDATVQGRLRLDLPRRRVESACLELAGDAKGKFFNGAHVVEDFTASAEVELTILRAADPDERRDVLAGIRRLAHASPQVRTAVQAELARADIDIAPILKEALVDTTDPEIRRRIARILERYGE